MVARLARMARWLLAFEYILNGLNWWWKVLPYPSLSDPPLRQTPAFVQAMIDTGFMFDGTKAVEVVTGLMLLADRWVPLALVVAFPVTVGIWSVDLFLIGTSVRAQVLGWSVLLLNGYLLLAYIRYFAPMLAARATPWGQPEAAGRSPRTAAGPPGWCDRAMTAFGVVSVAVGAAASAWLVVMLAQGLLR